MLWPNKPFGLNGAVKCSPKLSLDDIVKSYGKGDNMFSPFQPVNPLACCENPQRASNKVRILVSGAMLDAILASNKVVLPGAVFGHR